MSKFTERLWRELVREHGADLAKVRKPAAERGRRARPQLLAGTTLGLAGVGTVVALALGAASSSPAFAVTRNGDGTVTIAINQISAIPDANARLSSLQVRARVVAVQSRCLHPARASVPPVAVRQALIRLRQENLSARVDPRKIPAGRTLVIATWKAGFTVDVAPVRAVQGAVPNCVTIAASVHPASPANFQARVCQVTVHRLHGSGGGAGNSGPSTKHVTGNSGPPPTGNSGPPPEQVAGNSGPRPTGNSGPPPEQVAGNSGPPPTGNSGPPPTVNVGRAAQVLVAKGKWVRTACGSALVAPVKPGTIVKTGPAGNSGPAGTSGPAGNS